MEDEFSNDSRKTACRRAPVRRGAPHPASSCRLPLTGDAAPDDERPVGQTHAGQRLLGQTGRRPLRALPGRRPPQDGWCDADLNRVHLTGWLGSEPLLYDVGDHPVASMALASERRWCGPAGLLQRETTWFNLTAWEELAAYCGRLLHQGDRIYVEGTLQLWTELRGPVSYACYTITLDRIVLLAAGVVRASAGFAAASTDDEEWPAT